MLKIKVIRGPINPAPLFKTGAIWVDTPDLLTFPSILPVKVLFNYTKPLKINLKNREITAITRQPYAIINNVRYYSQKVYPILVQCKKTSKKLRVWRLRKTLDKYKLELFNRFKGILWSDFKFNNPEFWGVDNFYHYELEILKIILNEKQN